MRYAIIDNNTVTNVAEAATALAQNWVQTDTAGIGWTYSGGVFTAPAAPPAPEPEAKEWTKLAFRRLFTEAERESIDEFRLNFESDANLTANVKKKIRTGFIDYDEASVIRSDDPATAQMLGLFVTVGLLTSERPAEILA